VAFEANGCGFESLPGRQYRDLQASFMACLKKYQST